MTSLNSLKREVEILHKALAVNNETESKHLEKLLFFNEKLVEFSRICDTDSHGEFIPLDAERQQRLEKLNLEIEAYNAAHPDNDDDLIKLKPYLSILGK